MWALRAFLLGAAAGAVLVYVAAATTALAVTAAGGELSLAVGPVVILSVEGAAGGSETTFGVGLGVVAVLCGAGNALAAALMASRS